MTEEKGFINMEFKARVKDLSSSLKKLQSLKPRFAGEDHQTDIYFNTPNGRLKWREGNIENSLIYYYRENIAGIKKSSVTLFPHHQDEKLKSILINVLGIKIIVIKDRQIFFVDNVKIHFDRVKNIGDFIEVEAIDINGNLDESFLQKQATFYKLLFEIKEEDLIAESYSDMLLASQQL